MGRTFAGGPVDMKGELASRFFVWAESYARRWFYQAETSGLGWQPRVSRSGPEVIRRIITQFKAIWGRIVMMMILIG
ncbi:hypothetical protein GQ55_8G071900 [Panicum hallii var. hallii]|uniref:Uncharacterized protein n=1 Tax=Panicum hallii var. hallii TaxID=1504633 RepID=A0A2T7CLT7_9POAL|nr:hypothetical protein GQ55_8G071900 [Panicum hallii var. hallii]